MTRMLVTGVAALAIGALVTPSAAQDQAGDKVVQVERFGDDPCPALPDDDTIIVCVKRDEGERYRIPRNLRRSDSPRNESWTANASGLEIIDRFGVLNCSAQGAGGSLGCTQEMIDAAYADKETSSDVLFSQLIAQERERRLSTIDEDAADTQARVEELERAYLERLEAERDADLPGEGDTAPPPELVDADRVGPPPPDFGDDAQ